MLNTTSRGGGGSPPTHPPTHPRLITDIADYQMENFKNQKNLYIYLIRTLTNSGNSSESDGLTIPPTTTSPPPPPPCPPTQLTPFFLALTQHGSVVCTCVLLVCIFTIFLKICFGGVCFRVFFFFFFFNKFSGKGEGWWV